MPVTRLPNTRLAHLHGLLRTAGYTREALLDRINDILEQNGSKPISERTLYNDFNELKRQGANIVIFKPDRTYGYEQPFCLGDIEFDIDDIRALQQASQVLRKTNIKLLAEEIEMILKRNRDSRYYPYEKVPDYISFEDHTRALGFEHFENLSQAIILHEILSIHYQPFNKKAEHFLFHPYYMKEYRNRWFVLGLHHEKNCIYNLALDRIQSLKLVMDKSMTYRIASGRFDPAKYYEDIIGVTRMEGAQVEAIRLRIYPISAPYVLTKPLHKSQQVLEEIGDKSLIIQIHVEINYELVSTLLGFGDSLEVLSPSILRKKMQAALKQALRFYTQLD